MPQVDQQDQEVELTPEQRLAQQSEGFDEAITSTTSHDATADAAAATKTAEEAAKAAADAEAEAARVAAEEEANREVIPGYTAAALKAQLDKAGQFDALRSSLDKVNGKFGSLEQTIKALQDAKASGQAVQLTDADVEDLRQEYGPELASAFLKTLNKFGAKIGSTAGPEAQPDASKKDVVDQAKIDEALAKANASVDDRITQTAQKLELKILNVTHPDWKKVVRAVDKNGKDAGFNPDFKKWSATLSAEDQDRLYNSWDADFLSEKIGEFKSHLKTETADGAKKKNSTPNRLKTNVAPNGVPGSTPAKSALDEQREGYDSA